LLRGRGENTWCGRWFNPITNASVNFFFYFSNHYRVISNFRTKAFNIGHISHDNISDASA